MNNLSQGWAQQSENEKQRYGLHHRIATTERQRTDIGWESIFAWTDTKASECDCVEEASFYLHCGNVENNAKEQTPNSDYSYVDYK